MMSDWLILTFAKLLKNYSLQNSFNADEGVRIKKIKTKKKYRSVTIFNYVILFHLLYFSPDCIRHGLTDEVGFYGKGYWLFES